MNVKTASVIVLAALTMLMFAAGAQAEVETSSEAAVSVMSNYVWRGEKLSDSWVVQPGVSVSAWDFTAAMWSNYDGKFAVSSDDDTGKITETDVTLSYARSLGKASFEAGYIYYELEGLNDTQEVYLGASYDFIVSPSLTVYYDFDEGTGAYAVLALGYSHDLGGKAALSLGASASYLLDNGVVGVDAEGEEYSDLHNGEVSVSIDIPLGDMISITPMAAYSFPLSDDAEDAISAISFDGDEEVFYGGITARVSF